MKSIKKILAILLSVMLINSSMPPCQAQASWFSDLCGGLFTIVSWPIWVFCPDNPTFRKNNPFRKKVWEEQAQEEQKEKEREERYRKIVAPPQPPTQDYENIIAKLQAQLNGQQKKIEDLENQKNEPPTSNKPPKAKNTKLTQEQLEERLEKPLSEAVANYFRGHSREFRGTNGKDGRSFGLEDFEEAFNNNEGFRSWVNNNLKGKDGETPKIDYGKCHLNVAPPLNKNKTATEIENKRNNMFWPAINYIVLLIEPKIIYTPHGREKFYLCRLFVQTCYLTFSIISRFASNDERENDTTGLEFNEL